MGVATVDNERWKAIDDLFHAALQVEENQREQFLQNACNGDRDLRSEIESLLLHDALHGSTLEGKRPYAALTHGMRLATGTHIGPYHVESLLGAGGMGEVYKARDTRLDRTVAIKVLSWTLAGEARFRERFAGEARAVSRLAHPHICTLYDVGEQHGMSYLVMEYLEGETLAQRLEKGAVPLGEALTIAAQIAEGLEEAHRHGLIHRDIKPANVFLTARAGVKILDFGVAKVIDAGERAVMPAGARTSVGTIVGTAPYMSPEQLIGLPVDQRTDLFSFGVLLYELTTLERPFEGRAGKTIAEAILNSEPRDFGNAPVPPQLQAVIRKLLEKDPAQRFASADEVYKALKGVEASTAPPQRARLSRASRIAAAAVTLFIAGAGGWFWHESSRQQWALQAAAPEIERLLDDGEYVKAAALTQQARAVLPNDPTLEKLWVRSTGEVSIASVPSEADLSIRPYNGDPNRWQDLGKTPLNKIRLAQDAYVFRVTKLGFAPQFFIASVLSVLPLDHGFVINQTVKLRPEADVPADMVPVPSAARWSLPDPVLEAPTAQIDDFLIDRHEVTNEEYKKFVDAGGYRKREFWTEPFVKDGRTIPWEQAAPLFHDATGRPGPLTWQVGTYPTGQEKYPVAGISWYEASAYAKFVGKSLPTVYHWFRASQALNYTPVITPGSNFRGEGTQPVGSVYALSGTGTTDMAGNVKEWCLNEGRDAKRFIMGGGFGEPTYMFNHADAQSPWDRRPNFGVRLVKLDRPPSAAAAAHIEVTTRDFWNEKPVSDEVFKAYAALYAYDKGDLNAQVEEEGATPGWSRFKVSFDAAYGNERVTAHLFLPKNASPPFQAVVYFPGGWALEDKKLDLYTIEVNRDFLLKSGRALIFPIYKGTYERIDGLAPGGKPQAFFRDHVIEWSKDLGRTLDYLETRRDIDSTKIAYWGDSLGGTEGALLPAVEKRIKAAILASGGFQNRTDLPEVDPFNFVGHVTIPVLMLNGRYDNQFPPESSSRPLFHFLGTPDKDKKQVIYESGHAAFPHPDAIRECLDWLDKYLGPARH
jgi:serine/threonine protein kinase/dienelactone hydrolase